MGVALAPAAPRLRQYDEYRVTGSKWLARVPAHWRVRRLKFVARSAFSSVDKHTAEGEVPVLLCNYTDVYYRDFITPDIDFMSATATPDEIRRFGLRRGDVLLTKDSESWDDIAVPACVIEDLPGVLCGYHLAQVRPIVGELDGRYLFRVMQAHGINHQLQIQAAGITRFGLPNSSLRDAIVPSWLDGANITQTTARVAISNRYAITEFVALFLRSPAGRDEMLSAVRGAAQPGLTLGNLGGVRVPVPLVTEQERVVAEHESWLVRVDALRAAVISVGDRLREYRSALITAAVTGQIDVRGEVAA